MSEVPGLKALRGRIDALDRRVLEALAKRFEVVRAIGELKARHGLDTYQRGRWEALLAARLGLGAELGLSRRFTEELFSAVHEEALRIQRAGGRQRRSRR